MAKRLALSLTRSNLLQLREQLQQARAGHALLEQKREVLIYELLTMIQEAETRSRFAAAYTSLFTLRMRMGSDRLQWASLAQAAEIRPTVQQHSLMGVPVPLVQISVNPLSLPYGLGETSVALDEARARSES